IWLGTITEDEIKKQELAFYKEGERVEEPIKEERDRLLQKLYSCNRQYLRPYFNFILKTIEYVDKQEVLDVEQKKEYIRVLQASSWTNEKTIWLLMFYDYAASLDSSDNAAKLLTRQDKPFLEFCNKYNLLHE
ncbi:MAG: hypothetical protein HYZ54_07730, partial [Ignavibacteriae bacterium]|nr:hypothetical protein [Ignavibacteriota bacterium]